MDYERISPKAKSLHIITGFIFTSIVAMISALLYQKFGQFWILLLAVCIALYSLLLRPYLIYLYWFYKIDDRRVEIQRGFWFKSRSFIPILRIQHMDITTGPLQRYFQISDIELYTAGDTHTIKHIPREKVEEILESLNKKILESKE